MDNKNFQPEEKSAKERALEIGPAILAGIFLLLGMYFNNWTLKVVFCTIAGAICVGMYLFLAIREIRNRRKKKNENK